METPSPRYLNRRGFLGLAAGATVSAAIVRDLGAADPLRDLNKYDRLMLERGRRTEFSSAPSSRSHRVQSSG